MTAEFKMYSLKNVVFKSSMYSLVELKQLEKTVKIGIATNKETKNELMNQKFGFLFII